MARKCKAETKELQSKEAQPTMPKAKSVAKQIEESITIQFGGGEWGYDELKELAIAAYVREGHYRGNVKKLALYIKPEERKVYYVINDKASGSVDFE